jgi:hypothetical protein
MNEAIKPAHESPDSHDFEMTPTPDKIAVTARSIPALPDKTARKLINKRLVTTLTLTSRTCKWPIGDPVRLDFHYCGQLPQSGRPYCDTHDRMSYQPTPRKRSSGQ